MAAGGLVGYLFGSDQQFARPPAALSNQPLGASCAGMYRLSKCHSGQSRLSTGLVQLKCTLTPVLANEKSSLWDELKIVPDTNGTYLSAKSCFSSFPQKRESSAFKRLEATEGTGFPLLRG